MGIKVSGDKSIRRYQGSIFEFKVIERAAGNLAKAIVSRTQAGISHGSSRFAPYSQLYAKTKGVSPGDVNLTDTGKMLDGFRVVGIGDRGDNTVINIGFSSSKLADRATANEEGGKHRPARPWTEPDESMIDDLSDEIVLGLTI